MFLKGVWRCLLQDVNVMGHATSFFPDAWRASFRCEGTPLSFLRQVVGPRFKRREKDSEVEDMSVFELDTAKIYIALHGKQEENCTVKVRCSWLHCDIPLQRSETDTTCITATELFSFIEKCKQGGRYPCFAVETSLSGNRTWVFSSIDSADSSGVGYEVEAGNLIVLTQV